MKFSIIAAVVFGSILVLFSCECEDVTPTIPSGIPDPFQVSIESNIVPDYFTFFGNFFFNKSLDTSTVRLNQSVFIEGSDDPDLIRLFPESLRLLVEGQVEDCDPFSSCGRTITITFKGTGENVIRSIDGQILDGDYDNVDGGDYVRSFTF